MYVIILQFFKFELILTHILFTLPFIGINRDLQRRTIIRQHSRTNNNVHVMSRLTVPFYVHEKIKICLLRSLYFRMNK